jgi:hypothetical protein
MLCRVQANGFHTVAPLNPLCPWNRLTICLQPFGQTKRSTPNVAFIARTRYRSRRPAGLNVADGDSILAQGVLDACGGLGQTLATPSLNPTTIGAGGFDRVSRIDASTTACVFFDITDTDGSMIELGVCSVCDLRPWARAAPQSGASRPSTPP